MTTVFVTGASGFIAKHIVRELLENGYAVRAGVRSEPARAQLEALFPDSPLEFATVDLLLDDGWAQAMQGVDALLHTASPFPMVEPEDPQEVIRPAVEGTRRALTAAQAVGVRRVLVTSSCAAIYKDERKPRMTRSTAANWTEPFGPDTTAYETSKTLAEHAAWDFAAEHREIRLTTINPGMVFGPPMDEHVGASLSYVERFLSGSDRAFPKASFPAVDVRDVARIHVRALSSPDAVGMRYPANAGALAYAEAAGILAEAYPDRKISTREIPDWIVSLGGRLSAEIRPFLGNLRRNLDVDGSDAPRDLGFTYISSADALRASAEYLVARGA